MLITVNLPSPFPQLRSGLNEHGRTNATWPFPSNLSPPTRDVGFNAVIFQMGVAPRMGWGQIETRGETHAMGDPQGM